MMQRTLSLLRRSSSQRAVYPISIIVGLSAVEALGWSFLGRMQSTAPVLGLAFATGLVAASWVALSQRRSARAATWALRVGLIFGLLPFAQHAVQKLSEPLAPLLQAIPALGVALVLSTLAALVLAALGRFESIRSIAALLMISALAGLAYRSVPVADPRAIAQAGSAPDVVLIVMDTTRRDRLSLYGHERATTPALERLAEKARVYEDAWSVAPWTPPSHASLLTGLLPAEHGVAGRRVPAFPRDVESLATLLSRAGYRTAGLVANPNLHGPGWSRGFDVYAPPWFEGPHSVVAVLNRLLTRGRPAWLDDGASDRVLARARRWWQKSDDAPRFLFMNFVDPHDPYLPSESDRARFLPELSRAESLAVNQEPKHYALSPGIADDDRRVIEALYDAEIAGLDRRLGTFFDWLETRSELDDAIIVVTSDHGERLGERGLLGHLLVMDQHLLRVPLLLRYPGAIEAGRESARVQLTGVAGEILRLAGQAEHPQFATRLASKPSSDEARLSAPVAVAVAVAQHGPFAWYSAQLRHREPDFDDSAYAGHWNLVANDAHAFLWSPDRPTETGQLVALEGDPSWQVDLSESNPSDRSALLAIAKALPRYEDRSADSTADATSQDDEQQDTSEIDEATLQRLRALGYAD